MTKKDFVALADAIRAHNAQLSCISNASDTFTDSQLTILADFCAAQSLKFNRQHWLDYIAGNCGKNGGKVACDAKRECLNACREYVSKNRAVNG